MAVGETGNGTVYKGSIERVNIMKTVNVVAAIICNGSKYFATQRGYGEFKDWWEFPGGKIEPNETPEEALHREIKEELDIEITIDTHLVTVVSSPHVLLSLSRIVWRTNAHRSRVCPLAL